MLYLHSDECESDSSGNHSETDEVNMLAKEKANHHELEIEEVTE